MDNIINTNNPNTNENNINENIQKIDNKEKYLNQINVFLENLKDIKLEESPIPLSTNSTVESKPSNFNKTLTKIKNEVSSLRHLIYQGSNDQKTISHKNKPIFNKKEIFETPIEESEIRKIHSSTIILKQLLQRSLISQYQEGELIWNMLCGIIRNSTSSWLQQLLNIPTSTQIEFNDQEATIRGIILRAITKKNPSFKENGFFNLKKIPAIYTTSPSLVNEAVRGLCLPSSCIKVVPINKAFGQSHTMEHDSLREIIQQDLSENQENQFEPTLVIALAREDGHIDDTEKIKKVCEEFGVWLHVHGNSVGILFGNEENKKRKIIQDIKSSSHSFSFFPDSAFFGSSLPSSQDLLLASFFFSNNNNINNNTNNNNNNNTSPTLNPNLNISLNNSAPLNVWKMYTNGEGEEEGGGWERERWEGKRGGGGEGVPFSLWFMLQSMGSETLERGVTKAIEQSSFLTNLLDKTENIEMDNASNSFNVVFRFTLNSLPFLSLSSPSSSSSLSLDTPFLNKLNQQLFQGLQKDPSTRTLGIKLKKVEGNVVLVFEPLGSGEIEKINKEVMTEFIRRVEEEIRGRISGLKHRAYFQQKADQSNCLFHVETDKLFVGLGAVRYIPPYFKHQKDLASQIDHQLDVLNSSLSLSLSSLSPSFSLGHTSTSTLSSLSSPSSSPPNTNNTTTPSPLNIPTPSLPNNNNNNNNSNSNENERRVCVWVINEKEVSEEKIDEWILLIEKEGQKIEEQSGLLDNLSQIIEQGIKQAQKQIKEDSYANESGIIRSVPIIGSVWNWWSPAQKKEVVGRSFDLAGSKLETSKVVVTPSKTKPSTQDTKQETRQEIKQETKQETTSPQINSQIPPHNSNNTENNIVTPLEQNNHSHNDTPTQDTQHNHENPITPNNITNNDEKKEHENNHNPTENLEDQEKIDIQDIIIEEISYEGENDK